MQLKQEGRKHLEMASNVVPYQLTTPKKVNFARLSRIVIDLFARILRDILLSHYPHPEDLQKKIRDTHLEHKFKNDMNRILDGGGYEKCDVSLLYALIRYTCEVKPPTITCKRKTVWGGNHLPPRECTELGDELERMRIIRNRIFGHIHNTEVEDSDFEKHFGISLGICQRLTGKFGTKDYVKELETIKTCRMEADLLVVLTEKVKKDIEMNEELRDYVRTQTDKLSTGMNEIRQDIKELKDQQGSKSEAFVIRNTQGNIISLTRNALDLMRNLQSESKNEDSRKLINEVIIDICKSRNELNLQVLETKIRELLGSPFKNAVGMKLLDYLKQNADIFTVYQTKTEQWNVVVVRNCVPVDVKKRKTPNHHNPKSNRNKKMEDVDVSFVYPKNPNPKLSGKEVSCKSFHSESVKPKDKDLKLNVHRSQRFDGQTGKNSNQTLSSEDSVTQSLSEFLDKVHKFERSSESFALVVGKTNIVPNIDSLALIPWFCVFDFDMHSRENGLMSVLEGRNKTIHPCTLRDRPQFSFSYTYWCQLRGDSQVPDTRIECNARAWHNKMKANLEDHLEALKDYILNNTILKVIILCPEESEDIKFISKFITQFQSILILDVFVLYSNTLEESTVTAHFDVDFQFQVPLDALFSYLKTNIREIKPRKQAKYLLPTFNESNDPAIDEFTASHLRENFNILYLRGTEDCSYDVFDIKEEGKNFLRGGTLRWFVYYDENFDVERDQMDAILYEIENWFIKRSTSTILEVFHPPGAGGTTLSQRILWELHEKVPCLQLISNIQSAISDIVTQIKSLFEKTQLPLLVLVDGRDAGEVKSIYRQLRLQLVTVIILHVQRIRKERNSSYSIRGKYHIDGVVSKREAKLFCSKYFDFCNSDEKKDSLETIAHDVLKGGFHQVYEFGLTTFADEYKGIKSYVSGYLQLQPERELDTSQKVLGFLSLVYFYGQMSVPCELFSKLLERDDGITFKDLPFEVRQLVVMSNNHQHQGFIRICHHIIAKEILEQILTKNVLVCSDTSSPNLSQEACRNLVEFGIGFINEMGKICSKNVSWSKNIINEILSKTFIHRDTHDTEEYSFHRKKFSRFFTDVEKESSKHDRIRIMGHLVSCCPNNPNFHAHLGRMHTLYYPAEKIEIAEKHFKKAVLLCEKESNRANKEGNGLYEERFSSSTIYHMYGMHFYYRLSKISKDSEEAYFESNLEKVLDLAQNACLNFERARDNSFPGIGQSYGLMSEIMTRTEVCSYINKNLGMGLSECIKSPMSPMVAFVRESMVQICELIIQCYSTIDSDEMPQNMPHYIQLYKKLFDGQEINQLCFFGQPTDCTDRRHLITQIKLKYGKLDKYDILSLDNKTPCKDIREIVTHLEENFKDLEKKGSAEMKTWQIESDFRDWLNAIRLRQYDENIQLEIVFNRLRKWNEHVQTPMSIFYRFVLCATMAIVNKDKNHSVEAKKMLEEVKNLRSHFSKPYKPREWLGNHMGVKCLISNSFLNSKSNTGVDEIEIDNDLDVLPKFLKGTISGRNPRPQCGTISIDVCDHMQFDVFFVPVRTKEKLVGSLYLNQRVEFIMGFTVSHGFIAYNVKRLETVKCDKCPRRVEFVTNQKIAECKCGSNVQKLKADDYFYPSFR